MRYRFDDDGCWIKKTRTPEDRLHCNVAAALIVGAATVGGAYISSNAASKAAKAQGQGYAASTAEQARQYDQTREDFAPWREAGVNALGRLNRASTGDFSDFTASPDYNFARTEGMRGVEQGAAARGGAFSGNALKALSQFNAGLASSQYGDWWNRQAGLAGVGQSATQSTATFGANAANNISSNYIGAGNARASGINQQGQIWGNALSDLGGIYGYYRP